MSRFSISLRTFLTVKGWVLEYIIISYLMNSTIFVTNVRKIKKKKKLDLYQYLPSKYIHGILTC